jgi:Threonyl and Alanyl tRNA synthetase second additional domain
LALFADNPFKTTILQTKVPDGTRTTVYRCGDLIDLCRGPHLPHTGKVKAFAATRHSAAHWLGQADHDSLQRLYGISFPDKKMLKVWQENQEKVRGLFNIFPFFMTTTTISFLAKEKEKNSFYTTRAMTTKDESHSRNKNTFFDEIISIR